jgi:hypothetical protein
MYVAFVFPNHQLGRRTRRRASASSGTRNGGGSTRSGPARSRRPGGNACRNRSGNARACGLSARISALESRAGQEVNE